MNNTVYGQKVFLTRIISHLS